MIAYVTIINTEIVLQSRITFRTVTVENNTTNCFSYLSLNAFCPISLAARLTYNLHRDKTTL